MDSTTFTRAHGSHIMRQRHQINSDPRTAREEDLFFTVSQVQTAPNNLVVSQCLSTHVAVMMDMRLCATPTWNPRVTIQECKEYTSYY